MKSNNETKINFVNKFKFWMLIPIVLLLASIVLGVIFGLNLDYDFRTVSTFDVKFNTTVSDIEYNELEKSLDLIIDSKFDDYRIEKIGEGAQNGLLVKIVNNNGTLDANIEDIKATIEESLLDDFSNKEASAITVTTTDTNKSLPKNIVELVLYSVLALACIMIFVFIYNIFRYNFVSGVSIVLTILLEIAMLTSVMIVARVPFNYYFVISYFVMIIESIFMTTYINNQIKSTLSNDKYNKYSNADRIYDSVKKTMTTIILSATILDLCLFAVMFFGNLSLIYTIISILIGSFVALFASIIFYTSIWSFWYKKDKDASLRRRIESEKKKLENKDEEKIVV